MALACLVTSGVIALLGAEIVAYSRNSLLNHPDWTSGKLLLSHRLMGSHFGHKTRNLLHRNRLNMHEWFGSNELILARVFAPGRIEFSFRLSERAYLTVEFNRTRDSFCGVRLSRRESRPSAFLLASRDGRFLRLDPLEMMPLGGGWHRAALWASDDAMLLEVDGQPAARLPVAALSEQVIGFRSGQARTLVDDVLVVDAAGEVVIDETFRNDSGIWRLRLAFFLGSIGVMVAVAALFRPWRSDDPRVLFRLLLVSYLVVLALVSYLCIDYFIWSSRYPYSTHTPWRPGHKLSVVERTRRSVFSVFKWSDARDERGLALAGQDLRYTSPGLRRFLGTSDELDAFRVQVFREDGAAQGVDLLPFDVTAIRGFAEGLPADSTVILFLGTSQMEGTGAATPRESIAGHVFARLDEVAGRPVVVVNAAIRGSRSTELLRYYRRQLGPLTPDLVVVNLSHNDYVNRFADGLRGILATSRERGASSLFVLEAMTLDHDPSHLVRKHDIMSTVAAQAGVPVVDLYSAIAERERRDVGFIWWDLVHLTSFGQSVAAEVIAGAILEHFGELVDRPRSSSVGSQPPRARPAR